MKLPEPCKCRNDEEGICTHNEELYSFHKQFYKFSTDEYGLQTGPHFVTFITSCRIYCQYGRKKDFISLLRGLFEHGEHKLDNLPTIELIHYLDREYRTNRFRKFLQRWNHRI